MIKPLKQEDFNFEILEDLPKEKGKRRFTLFKCPLCLKPFKADTAAIKNRPKQKGCKACIKTMKLPLDLRLFVSRLNSHTRYNARKRNMDLPFWKNGAELAKWLLNQPNWWPLWHAYEKSNFNKNLAPSIDRLDNTKSYTKKNIELITWDENNKRGRDHRKTISKSGQVSIFYQNGLYINTYKTINEAKRDLNCKNLHKTLTGERKHACDMIAKIEPLNMTVYMKIRRWAYSRNLIQQGDTKTQFIKLTEELAELGTAIVHKDISEIHNALGDIAIVLTNIAAMENVNIEEVIQECQEEIGLRKGQMINGTFVKEK